MFGEEGQALLKGLSKLLDDGTFPLQKKELAAFVTILKWLDTLPEKMEKSDKMEQELKELKKPSQEAINAAVEEAKAEVQEAAPTPKKKGKKK